MKQDNESWPPEPTKSDIPSKHNNSTMVSAVPLGVVSCVLSSLLFGTHVALLLRLHQMKMEENQFFDQSPRHDRNVARGRAGWDPSGFVTWGDELA